MIITIEKILEFHDLFPKEKELNITTVLKKYSREYLVRSGHVLSNNFGVAFIPDPDNTFFSDISRRHIDDLNKRIEKHFKESGIKQVCYSTMKTALELMRIIFSIPVAEYRNDGNVEDFEYDLFRVVIQINENLMKYSSAIEEKNQSVLMFLFHYVINDISSQNLEDSFIKQVNYFSVLSEYLSQENKCSKARDTFFKKAGIGLLDEYSKTWLALFVLTQNSSKKSCQVLDTTILNDVDSCLSHSVLDFMSIGVNDYIPYDSEERKTREDNVDYRTFRSHPLVKIAEGKYLIYCMPILLERLYNGLFFDLKEGFKGDFFSFYNKEFIERKLFQPQILNCTGKKSTAFFPKRESVEAVEIQTEDPNQPDFYLREKDCLMLFECKAIKLNGEIKDKRDVDTLLNVLKNKLYLSTTNLDPTRKRKRSDENVGVTQLVHQMMMIDADEFGWDKRIPECVAYYPVLVLEDHLLVVPGLSGIINEWYKPLIAKELPDQMCHPIVVMSIDTLIMYEDIFKNKGFHHVFDEYFKSVARYDNHCVSWIFDPLADFNFFMEMRYNVPVAKKNRMFEAAKKALGIDKTKKNVVD